MKRGMLKVMALVPEIVVREVVLAVVDQILAQEVAVVPVVALQVAAAPVAALLAVAATP